MSKGIVQPAIVRLVGPMTIVPNPVHQRNVVQPAVITLEQQDQTIVPEPVV